MEPRNEKTPLRIDAVNDPVFKKALERQPTFMSRLESAKTYDDIIFAVESAAVDDGEGEMVIFDIDGYVNGSADENIEAETHPLEMTRAAIEFVRDNPYSTYEEIQQIFEHISVRNAVISIWALKDKSGTQEVHE